MYTPFSDTRSEEVQFEMWHDMHFAKFERFERSRKSFKHVFLVKDGVIVDNYSVLMLGEKVEETRHFEPEISFDGWKLSDISLELMSNYSLTSTVYVERTNPSYHHC